MNRPTTNTSSGQLPSEPPMPSSTGVAMAGGDPHEAGVDEADERDEQADADADGGLELERDRAEHGLARNPVATRSRMIRPSSTTMPMASCHDMPGSAAIE